MRACSGPADAVGATATKAGRARSARLDEPHAPTDRRSLPHEFHTHCGIADAAPDRRIDCECRQLRVGPSQPPSGALRVVGDDIATFCESRGSWTEREEGRIGKAETSPPSTGSAGSCGDVHAREAALRHTHLPEDAAESAGSRRARFPPDDAVLSGCRPERRVHTRRLARLDRAAARRCDRAIRVREIRIAAAISGDHGPVAGLEPDVATRSAIAARCATRARRVRVAAAG